MATCGDCKYMVTIPVEQPGPPEGQPTTVTIHECHFSFPAIREGSNRWAKVEPDEWCGDYLAVGARPADQYLHGALALQDTTVVILLTLPAAAATDNAVIRGCQLLNTSTNDSVVVSFLDGPVETNVLGFVSCAPKQSKEVEFMPGLMASVGNNICVKLDQSIAPGHMYVTAQGFVLGQETSVVVQVSGGP